MYGELIKPFYVVSFISKIFLLNLWLVQHWSKWDYIRVPVMDFPHSYPLAFATFAHRVSVSGKDVFHYLQISQPPSAREVVGFHGKITFGKNHMPIKLISPKDVVPGTKVKILTILNGSSGSFSCINISQFVACLWLVSRVLKNFFFIVLFDFLLALGERIGHIFILP